MGGAHYKTLQNMVGGSAAEADWKPKQQKKLSKRNELLLTFLLNNFRFLWSPVVFTELPARLF